MATNGAAIVTVCWSKPTAIVFAVRDGNRLTTRVIKAMTIKNVVKMCMENTALCEARVKAGKKTCVKAPYAKILLKRFGSLKAMKKISL